MKKDQPGVIRLTRIFLVEEVLLSVQNQRTHQEILTPSLTLSIVANPIRR